jgi:hypothetical protein
MSIPRAAPCGHGRGRVAEGEAGHALGADRLDVPGRRAEVAAVGDAGKGDAVFARSIACSTARRKPASSSIEVSSVSIHSL